MDEENCNLGFKPQKDVPYNKLLPYADLLDAEAVDQLAQIKANFGRSVQLRDIKFGGSHWTGQLSKYIRLYGHRYSKEDHLAFIHLAFELITIPDLELSLVYKFSQLLITLLKKRELISRDDLVLPWRPLYKLVDAVVYSNYEQHGLQLIPANMENLLKGLVRICRVYFSEESTQEMMDEWRPLLCPFDMTMMQGMYYFDLFLPTTLPPEKHYKGFKLWFDELMGLWLACQNSPSWEANIVNLFSRLAHDAIGYIDWTPYIPTIFTRILRSLNLPVGTGDVQVGRTNNCYEVGITVQWICYMMGGGHECQEHIDMLFKALESFYHPSNHGKWNGKLVKLMVKLCDRLVRRVHRERYKEPTWETPVPESHKLCDADITKFVLCMKPVVLLAMFSKLGSHDAAATFQQLAVLRPELVIPPLLERTYPALETLTEPHRLIACLNCTVSVARSLLKSNKWYSEGRSHVLPLLNLSLPGIDPNDIKKCLTTFQLVSTLASLVPLVDCSSAIHCRTDLTEEEKELCSATAQFEDFVMQFMDRVLGLIENSSSDHARMDSSANDKLNPEESMLEVGLLSTFNAIMQQSSALIYQEALGRLFRFVSTSVFEIRVAGRFTADLCRAAAKVNPEAALKKFVMHFCGIIKNKTCGEDVSKDERLDEELLWNLKLLSEIVRCNGKALLPYSSELITVLRSTLYLRCKEGYELAGTLLCHLLKALTLIHALDYRSTRDSWDRPLEEHLPIRDWGKPGDLHDLNMKWHVPSDQEKRFATELLENFLLPQLQRIDNHVAGTDTMTREELQQCLGIVVHCIVGAGSMLPMWQSPPVKLIDCLVELTRFNNCAGTDSEGLSLNGKNIRQLIANSVKPLLDHMLATSEDDTKGLIQVIKVYGTLMYYHGTQKEEFDTRWKSLHIVKRSMENKLLGKKRHIRALLVDRAQLQHELRVINRTAKTFTEIHRDLFTDLFKLSISRYSEVRKRAQGVLSQGFHLFAYSYRTLLDSILDCLKDDPSVEHHQFKGALYIILGEHKRCLATKRNWDVMNKVWPVLVKAQHSEKPSILKLIDGILDKLCKNVETTELSIITSPSSIKVSYNMWESSPKPSLAAATPQELVKGEEEEVKRNDQAHKSYEKLVLTLTDLAETGNLRWKYLQIAVDMIGLLVRHDCQLPPPAVSFFVKNMVHDSIQIRKLCTCGTASILKQQKRKHKKVEFDPHKVAQVAPPTDPAVIQPGDRPDNLWHHYSSTARLDTAEKYDNAVFVDKTHWGYYVWPSPMMKYAPANEQPKLRRSLDELSPPEKPLYECFTSQEFVDKLMGYLSLEEQKGKDKFSSRHFTLFKGLFRNFGDTFLPLIKPHVEKFVADTKHDTHDSSQRCASEIIAGLIRGAKHWDFEMADKMWAWLVAVMRTSVNNMTVETVADWGTCYATAAESRDPRKIAPMLELLMDNPMRGEGGSFGDSSRLYVLQGALAQQEWRVPELLHNLIAYLEPHLTHPYKNVRDRMGSVLTNIFLYDFMLPNSHTTTSPRREDFIHKVLAQLETLKESMQTPDNMDVESGRKAPGEVKIERDEPEPAQISEAEVPNAALGDIQLEMVSTENHKTGNNSQKNLLAGETEERKTAIKLLKTVMKWLQGSFGRMLQCAPPEIFQFLPIISVLESETKDDELRHDCMVTLACMAQALLKPEIVPLVLDTIKKVAGMTSWHARAAILGYTQVMVFCNLFLVLDADVKQQIRNLVVGLLCDDQLEVREMAAVTLGGFLHCGYLKMDRDLMSHFEKLSSTKIKKKRQMEANKMPELLIKRHAGVLGLSACVQAFPYDVPEFIPEILMDLSDHLDDPQPIQMTVKKTLSNFKRTHQDNWLDHKQKFTDDQLVVLTNVLVSPNYYA